MSCKYYGGSAQRALQIIVSTGGNQCATIMHKQAPCEMELAGTVPDHAACHLARMGDKFFEGWQYETLVPPAQATVDVTPARPSSPARDLVEAVTPLVDLVDFIKTVIPMPADRAAAFDRAVTKARQAIAKIEKAQ
jgi:hypothetical protein